jgi:hypothetical protein
MITGLPELYEEKISHNMTNKSEAHGLTREANKHLAPLLAVAN